MHMISILYIQTYIGVICLLDQISAGINMRIVFVLRVYGYIAGIFASIEIEDSYVWFSLVMRVNLIMMAWFLAYYRIK